MATFARRTGGGNILSGRQGAVRVQASLKGADQLYRALAAIDRATSDRYLVAATQAAADILAEGWREQVRSRIGTGPGTAHYAEAIQASARAGKRGATGLVSLKRSVPLSEGESHPREYASRFEFGSARATAATLSSGRSDFAARGRAAVPTLRPAFDANVDRMTDAIGDELRRLIEGAV